jgi:hypothetical protein
MSNRRMFLKSLSQIAAASAMGVTMTARAELPKLDEKDPQATALGYTHDSTKVDKVKFPKHTVAQQCNNCQLFQGKVADAWAPCSIFAGKQVSGKGWCSAYTKKA